MSTENEKDMIKEENVEVEETENNLDDDTEVEETEFNNEEEKDLEEENKEETKAEEKVESKKDESKHKEKDKKKKKSKKETSYLKVFIIAIVSAVIIALIIVGVLVLLKGKEPDQKEVLETRLKELAKDFYEVKYYPNLTNSKTGEIMTDEEKKEFVAKFKDTGITIDLDSLARLFPDDKDAILEEFKNGENTCSYSNTKIKVYPKSPYENTSYELEVILDCGFEEE